MLKVLVLSFLSSAALIGIDLGSEFIKVSLIRPGKKLVIVENEQSQRSTPNAISFTGHTRQYGYNALKDQPKNPKNVLTFTHNLLSNISMDHYHRIYMPHPYALNLERQTWMLNIKEVDLELEEITAMTLEHLKSLSEKFSETSIKDCTITVPNFWTRDTRIRLINSASAIGVNILALINENTAAAYYFGLDRLDSERPVYVLFYNLGASYLQTTLVKYSVTNVTVSNVTRSVETVEVLAHSFDETLGGSNFDSDLALLMAGKFQEEFGEDIKVKIAMIRLFTHANLAKKVLSASRSHLVVLNSLYKDIDFSYNLMREELEEIIEKYSERLVKPIFNVLETAGLKKEDISFLEILGGPSRIPKVQEIIKEKTGLEVSSHLNGDEAMAHGSVLIAANMSSIVQVKPLFLKDICLHLITAQFLAEDDALISEIVLFEKYTEIGSLKAFYLDYKKTLSVALFEGEEKRRLGYYNVSGIDKIDSDDFRLVFYFAIDYSSLAYLYKVEALYQKVAFADSETSDEENSEEGSKNRKVLTNETVAVPLRHAFIHNGSPRLINTIDLRRIQKKLQDYKETEKAAQKLVQEKNDFEAHVYTLSDKLDESSFEQVTDSEERDKLRSCLSTAKEWMETEEFRNASLETLAERKKDLQNNFKDALEREREHDVRDSVVGKAKKKISDLEKELISVNESKPWLSQEELEPVWKTLNETLEWIVSKDHEQKQVSLSSPLVFTSQEVADKLKNAEGLVEKLKRISKPKEKEPFVPEFMKSDKDFDWEKFKAKYEKEKNKESEQGVDEKNLGEEEAKNKDAEEEKKNKDDL